MIDQAVYVYNQETMEVFEVAIGSKKKKKIYKPDKTDVLYYTYKNHLIREIWKRKILLSERQCMGRT